MESNEQSEMTPEKCHQHDMAFLQSYFGSDRCGVWRERLIEHWRATVLANGPTTTNEVRLLEIYNWNRTPEEYAEQHLLFIANNFFSKLKRSEYAVLRNAQEWKYDYSDINLTILPIRRFPQDVNGALGLISINGFVQLTGIVRNESGQAKALIAVCRQGIYDYAIRVAKHGTDVLVR